jgi:hypothetical protein
MPASIAASCPADALVDVRELVGQARALLDTPMAIYAWPLR